MIYNFFYLKCAINLNENCRVTCRKTKMCPLNITILHKFLYGFTKRSTKYLFFKKKISHEKRWKYVLLLRLKPNLKKTGYTEKKGAGF